MSKQKLSAKEVLKDLRSGMSDAEIMDKYKISEKGLQSLFNKLTGAGVVTQAQINSRSEPTADPTPDPVEPGAEPKKPAKGKIDAALAKAILEDKKAGLHENEIMFRHELSPGQFHKIVDKLIEKGHLPREGEALQGSVGVTCPHCSASVPPTAYRCPECNEVVDSSDASSGEGGQSHGGFGAPRPQSQQTTLYDDKECPWDDHENYGIFNAYFQTAVKIFTGPTSFFQNLPLDRGYMMPLVFGVFSAAIPVAVGLFIISLIKGSLATGIIGMIIGFVCAFIGAAVTTPIFLLIWGGVIHGILVLLQGAKSGYQATLRVVSYASVTQLFNAIPYVGWLASLYGLFLTVVGLKETHETSTGKAVGAVAIPFGILLVIGVVLYFTAMSALTGMLVPGMAGGRDINTQYSGELLPEDLCAAIDDYWDKIDSTEGMGAQDARTALAEAIQGLQQASLGHRKEPGFKEYQRTIQRHFQLIAVRIMSPGGLSGKSASAEAAIRERLANMCGN